MARIKMKSNRQKAWEHETRKSEVIAKRQSLTKASPAREELEEYDSGFESDEDLKVPSTEDDDDESQEDEDLYDLPLDGNGHEYDDEQQVCSSPFAY